MVVVLVGQQLGLKVDLRGKKGREECTIEASRLYVSYNQMQRKKL